MSNRSRPNWKRARPAQTRRPAHINEVQTSIGGNATRMSSIAQVLQQQAQAVEDISRSVHAVATHAKTSSDLAGEAITSVAASETLINQQFAFSTADRSTTMCCTAPSPITACGRSALSELFVGLANFTAGELADHSHCRLGKWYDQIKDPAITGHPAFKRLLAPHQAVHQHGKKAAELIAAGDRKGRRSRSRRWKRRPTRCSPRSTN